MIPYTPPQFDLRAFNCPTCNAFANHHWSQTGYWIAGGGMIQLETLKVAFCANCHNFSIWRDGKMISPEQSGIALPNDDLDTDIAADYLEARSIVGKSPRGAAALLRLCIQKLCIALGGKGKILNDDISDLVKKGLSPTIQKSLDIVRVIGNNAVHPGQIDLRDDSATALRLFDLTNLIADSMITQPKQIDDLYKSLPETDREAIEKRDK